MSSILNIDNYSNHRPMTMIYQNLDIVSEGSPDRTSAVLIGSQGTPGFNYKSEDNQEFDSDYNPGIYLDKNPGLILIRSQADIDKKLRNKLNTLDTPKNELGENPLADAAELALIAGGGDPFYCITTTIYKSVQKVESINGENYDVYKAKDGETLYYKKDNVYYSYVDETFTEADITDSDLESVQKVESTENWSGAKNVLRNNDRTLFVCPITRNIQLQKEIVNVCEELSQPDVQKWKRCYIGLAANTFSSNVNDDNNGYYVQASNLENAISIDDLAFKGSNAYYKVNGDYKLLYEDNSFKTVLTIDKFKVDEDNTTLKYYYKKYDENQSVTPQDVKPKAKEIYYQTLVGKLAESQGQRTCLIWCPGAYSVYANEDGKIEENHLPPEQLAAGITALRASILPQQGLSRRLLPWIYQIPSAWGDYDQYALDHIATKGVFIITQDDPDSDVYIRHQLTSDLTRGILYYEDSVGVNVDTICYGLKDIVKGYVGQRNNTNDTLLEIKNRVLDYLSDLTTTGVSIEARKIGPQISQVDFTSVIVKLDDNFKDRVIISVDIVVPVPLNQIHVHLNAFASLANTSSTNV